MNESYTPLNWYGKEFTVTDGVIMLILMLLYLPMHEFGHWVAYWIFGIPAEFGIMFEPFFAYTVQPLIELDIAVRLFASFFGGGFVFIVAGIIAIKSRPSLMVAIFGLAGGIAEVSFLLISGTDNIHHFSFLYSNMAWYAILQLGPLILVIVFGFPEFRQWLRLKIRSIGSNT